MLASGRSSLTFLIEGSVDAATRGDAAIRGDVGAFLASLSVENNIFVKGMDNMSETVQYYAFMTRHRSRRLGTADGFAARLERKSVADGASPGCNDVLTYSKWDEYMKELRGLATLQQLLSLQMSVLPGIRPVRIDVIMAAGYKTPKYFALVYGRFSEADSRALLTKFPPLPGVISSLPRCQSTFTISLWTSCTGRRHREEKERVGVGRGLAAVDCSRTIGVLALLLIHMHALLVYSLSRHCP